MAAFRGGSALVGALAACLGLGSGMGACASHDTLKPPPRPRLGSGGSDVGAGAGGGDLLFGDGGLTSGPPAPDAGDLCGNETHAIVNDPPNIYFVLDTSGSMNAQADPSDPSSPTEYQVVARSAALLVQALGSFIRVGAAIFPKNASAADGFCDVGGEVFPVTLGDPVPSGTGTTRNFALAIDVLPVGGTPTAATLVALKPGLVALAGKTIVILATDGGPNCNAAATCSADQCITNIADVCDVSNCCAVGGPDGPEGCLDRDPTVAAVADLAKAGILVYVIGLYGSEVFTNLLGDLAKAGGAPLPAAPFYYDVANLSALESVFQTIAGGAISCDFTITDPPPDRSRTNVWLDGRELTQDPDDGWVWLDGQSKIELVGSACSDLKAAKVRQVQIVSGCPTKVPK